MHMIIDNRNQKNKKKKTKQTGRNIYVDDYK